MKKWIWILIACLCVWNLYLTARIQSEHKVEEPIPQVEGGTTIVQNTLNGYTTDITEVAEKIQSRIVCLDRIEQEEKVYGSGIIYTSKEKDVYIITSATFLNDAQKVNVTFDNGKNEMAELVGKDDLTDIAVLVVHPDFICESISLGDAKLVKQGEYVIALGAKQVNTQAGSVSFGVVSKPAQLLVKENDKSWITSTFTGDVNLNRENIGGPLVNLDGQLIGMLSGKLTSLNSSAGISSSVASNEIALVCKQIITQNKIVRGYLGVVTNNVKDLAVYQKSTLNIPLDTMTGLICSYIEKGSPAEIAGLSSGDVLMECNGKPLKDRSTLHDMLYTFEPGDKVEFKIMRDGRSILVSVVLA